MKNVKTIIASTLTAVTLLAGLFIAAEEQSPQSFISDSNAAWTDEVSTNDATVNTGAFNGVSFRNRDTYANGVYNLGQFFIDGPVSEGQPIVFSRFL